MELVLVPVAAFMNASVVKAFRRNNFVRFALWGLLTVWTTVSISLAAADWLRIFEWMPGVEWLRACGVCWLLATPAAILTRHCIKPTPDVVPVRRKLLKAAAAVATAPVAAVAFGFHIARNEAEVKEVDIHVSGLPRDLDGLRIVQISDIHLSPFYSRRQLRRVIDQSNELRASLAVITGDLITSAGDPLDDAIAELKRIRATDGIFGCLGNHEIVARAEAYTTQVGARAGITFLRSQAVDLRFGNARINLAGVDYQRLHQTYLKGTERLLLPESFNLLLSHNPDVFPVAARQGWDLTLAGHTHGGQVNFEFLHPVLNPARYYTPFTYGRYSASGRAMFVTSGLGTVGVPSRFGTAPEIALVRLVCA